MTRNNKDEDEEQWIERRIATGMIISSDFLRIILPTFKLEMLQSSMARIIAGWCVDYFKQYTRAPGRDIESIYAVKLREGLDQDQAEAIELILSGLSDEYERGKFNTDYLVDEARKYFSERRLQLHLQQIKDEMDAGALTEAERIASGFTPIAKETHNIEDPFLPSAVIDAFEKGQETLIHFGRALGEMWDDQFTRDSFVALLGREKIGKSQMLLEIAMRGLMENCNVAFFQAGDMTAKQQRRRIYTYLAQKSDKEKYCGEMLVPIIDCIHNQNDTCTKHTSHGGVDIEQDLNVLSFEMLQDAYHNNPEYHPCRNDGCVHRRPTVWFRMQRRVDPLTADEARRVVYKFKQHYKKRFKLATYPNETLTFAEINRILDLWEKEENFVPG